MSQKRCKECGREYEYSTSGYDPFCSEGCRARAHKRYQEEYLEKMQKKGKKKLAKWEKALEKDKKRIEKLKDALRGDDPKAIEKALKRGPLGCLWGILRFLFGFLLIAWIAYSQLERSDNLESTTVETSVEVTSGDLITEYQSVVNEVVKATPSSRKAEVEAYYARAIETFKSSSIEEQKRHLEIVKKELEILKQTPSNSN